MMYRVLPLILLIAASGAHAALTCTSSAVPALVSAEGLTERMGDIVLTCAGGTPAQMVTGNLTLFQSVNITNRTDAAGRTDIELRVDSGSPLPLPPVFATSLSAFSVVFNGLSFGLSNTGTATLRITNLRGAAAMQTMGDPRPVTAALGFNGPLAITNTMLNVGLPARGLLAGSSSSTIYCVGSPAPAAAGLSGLFAAGTGFHSTRLTEGWANAFQKGVRLMARYTGLPAGARLVAPDFVAGSSAAQATAGGDLGLPRSGGQYLGGSGALLLALVQYTDSDGAGGVLAGAAPAFSQAVAFDSVSELPVRGGSAVIVYEVLESNPAQQESAQFPAFLIYTPPQAGGDTPAARQSVSFAPLSTVAVGDLPAPLPRFAYAPPPNDCSALRDCDAAYFPRLVVDSPPLTFTAPAGSGFQIQYIRVNNEGGGILNWSVALSYRSGLGWLRVFPTSGQNNATIRIDALPGNLTPGVYEADLTIDAGPLAGSRTARVRLEVTAFVPPPPAIRSVVNGATFQPGPLAPGSIATLFGLRLAGRDLAVTFDSLPARILFSRDDQINLLVPAELAGRLSAQVVVRVEGVSSGAAAVTLAAIAPGVFGVLNQDSTINSASNPALVGTVVQVFATGLPESAPATILARVHDREAALPVWAGPAPGLPGVQQVNVRIPDELPAMTTDIRLCAHPPGQPAALTCSPPAKLTLQ